MSLPHVKHNTHSILYNDVEEKHFCYAGDKGSSKKTWIIIGATLSTIVGVLLLSSFAYTMWRRKKRGKKQLCLPLFINHGPDNHHHCCYSNYYYFVICTLEEIRNSQVIQLLDMEGRTIEDDCSNEIMYGEVKSQDSLLIQLDIVLKATNQYSNENKLGQGGFGPVYKVLMAIKSIFIWLVAVLIKLKKKKVVSGKHNSIFTMFFDYYVEMTLFCFLVLRIFNCLLV